MNKSNTPALVKRAELALTKHSPEILIGLGITGMIGSVILAVKATPKALRLLEEKKKEERVDTLKPVEVIKTTWKCYIPTAVTCASSIACVLGANSVHAKRNAALATAYKITETAFTDYKDKVVETIGEKQEKVVRDSIAKDKVEKDPVTNKEVVITEKGTTLCYDAMFGRYFKSDREEIERAITKINRRIVTDMYVSLNEFYIELGLEPIKIGNDLGWNIDDGTIEIEPSAQLATDGTPCLVLDYNIPPKYDFSRFM